MKKIRSNRIVYDLKLYEFPSKNPWNASYPLQSQNSTQKRLHISTSGVKSFGSGEERGAFA